MARSPQIEQIIVGVCGGGDFPSSLSGDPGGDTGGEGVSGSRLLFTSSFNPDTIGFLLLELIVAGVGLAVLSRLDMICKLEE